MGIKRKIIEIDEELCNGCGECIISCAEGAIQLVNGKAKVVADKFCDGLGACLGECPAGALKIIERDADAFDEAAVEGHLKKLETAKDDQKKEIPSGCPSAAAKTFDTGGRCERYNDAHAADPNLSELSHWPVKIKLISPDVPFLKGADLLVAADCSSVANPNFHADFMRKKVVMTGCPKFDDVEPYRQKFADIFRCCDIKSVTVVVMEVPCCSGFPMIVKAGMDKAGVKLPIETVTLTLQGDVKERKREAA